jgi:hypothetical protein
MVGGGYLNGGTEVMGQTTKISGGGANLDFAVGAAVSDNFAVFGELLSMGASNPDFEVRGQTVPTDNLRASIGGLGAGAAYFVMPANLFIAGSLVLTSMTLTREENDEKFAATDRGLGINAVVGKEWWVSDNWGLGAAAQLFLARMKDSEPVAGSKPTWIFYGAGVAFTATFN